MKSGRLLVSDLVCVGYRRHRNRKDRKQARQELLFAAWKVFGTQTEIRERCGSRFGIETSFRQMRQARIYTCTRSPRLRQFFLALILRNFWVWIRHMRLADGVGDNRPLHLERLRFKRMLDWLAYEVAALFHDDSPPSVVWSP